MRARVQQEDPHGCGVATVAMILSWTYADAKAEFEGRFGKTVEESHGFTYYDALEILAEHDFYFQHRFRVYKHNQPRDNWPPEPWAPIHYCTVTINEGGPSHACVMLDDGLILDPWTDSLTHLSDYANVSQVIGLRRWP